MNYLDVLSCPKTILNSYSNRIIPYIYYYETPLKNYYQMPDKVNLSILHKNADIIFNIYKNDCTKLLYILKLYNLNARLKDMTKFIVRDTYMNVKFQWLFYNPTLKEYFCIASNENIEDVYIRIGSEREVLIVINKTLVDFYTTLISLIDSIRFTIYCDKPNNLTKYIKYTSDNELELLNRLEFLKHEIINAIDKEMFGCKISELF